MSTLQSQEVILYQPHLNQQKIVETPERFKVICCGRRFGKTTLAINELLYHALLNPRSQFWYVAPTYRQAKEIAWRMLVFQYNQLPQQLQRGKNEAELWVEVGNKSRISLKGAENEDALRGSGLNGMILDEVASFKKWRRLWDEALAPSLIDKKGWAWFIGTPKGFNHFYDLYNLEQKDKDYKSFHFTSYDNPFLPKEEIDKEKARRTEDSFAQEYMADFRKHTGLVYKVFDRTIHTIEPIELPSHWQFYRSMDFGAVNPTVCLSMAVDNSDNVYVFDEYYNSGQTALFHANVINARAKHAFIATFGDPSAAQEMLDYAQSGLIITPALKVIEGKDNDWVLSGIEKVSEAFKRNPLTNRPRLYIFKNCVNLIKELESYQWMETKTQDLLKDIPLKENDHGPDALRYFIVSYQGRYKEPMYEVSVPANKFTGY